MADLKDNAAIVPAGATTSYALTIREFDAAGRSSDLTVQVPLDATIETIKGNLLLRAAILKSTTWNKFNIPQILHAIMFADRLGLDIELGDVYSTDGRPAISAEGRIKLALATGRIKGISTQWRELDDPAPAGCVLKKDLECTVTIQVADWDKPVVRTARLSRWFKNTPAWKERPEHQLELNTIGHACRLIRPVGDPADTPEPEPQVSAAQSAARGAN
jgi:hypothetical protein